MATAEKKKDKSKKRVVNVVTTRIAVFLACVLLLVYLLFKFCWVFGWDI